MSKTRKKRDNQVYVKDIEDWKATLAKPILLVAEMFAPHFGPCEIMFPFIDELMMALDNQGQADEVHWAIVNVAKLEDEKAAANVEDALKKQETTKVGDEKPKVEGDTACSIDAPSALAALNEPDEPNHDGDATSGQLDTTIPHLEKYAGFNHPTPHYVFFRNGIVIDELRGANPPKLEQLVHKWIVIKDVGAERADEGSEVAPVAVPAIVDPDLAAIPPEERPRRGSMSLYAPDDDAVTREPSPEPRSPTTTENASDPVAPSEPAAHVDAGPGAEASNPGVAPLIETKTREVAETELQTTQTAAAEASPLQIHAAPSEPAQTAGAEASLTEAQTAAAEALPTELAQTTAAESATPMRGEPPTIPT